MIRKAESNDIHTIAELACQLWPDHTAAEMEAEMGRSWRRRMRHFSWRMMAKMQSALPSASYGTTVEGTESSPVGYLEGIYVADGYRNQGIARELLFACENWAKEKGCTEFASDCELDNVQSLRFHLNVGFAEANRIICFTKKL